MGGGVGLVGLGRKGWCKISVPGHCELPTDLLTQHLVHSLQGDMSSTHEARWIQAVDAGGLWRFRYDLLIISLLELPLT